VITAPSGQALLEHEAGQPRRELRRGREVGIGAGGERDRHRGDTEERAFAGAAHRARVEDVLAEVRAAIDARHDEIGPARQQLHQREVHAIGGRPVDGVDPLLDALRAQRVLQRQRLAAGADLAVRRDDVHLAALAQRRAQRLDARRVHAVVVRDQDEWLSHRQERPRPR